jgi:hypothetical protein
VRGEVGAGGWSGGGVLGGGGGTDRGVLWWGQRRRGTGWPHGYTMPPPRCALPPPCARYAVPRSRALPHTVETTAISAPPPSSVPPFPRNVLPHLRQPGRPPTILHVLSKASLPPEVLSFKPQFMRSLEGELNFGSATLSGPRPAPATPTPTPDGASTRATHNTSYDSFRSHNTADSSDGYFPALSSSR